jgi:hypothetical protein
LRQIRGDLPALRLESIDERWLKIPLDDPPIFGVLRRVHAARHRTVARHNAAESYRIV